MRYIPVKDTPKTRAAFEKARDDLMTPYPGGIEKLAEDLLVDLIEHAALINDGELPNEDNTKGD